MFQMMGVFAEFEREMIKERVNAGLDRARAQGKRLGRPPVPPVTQGKVLKLRQEGYSMGRIATQVGLSKGKVHAICSAK
jgi:DNA invertase Pin-like site-specific DNA recombinase